MAKEYIKGTGTMDRDWKRMTVTLLILGLFVSVSQASMKNRHDCYNPRGAKAPKVDVYNYARAESDMQFLGYIEKYGAFGRFVHNRKAYDIDNQITQSGNRDTIYSFAVFDLSGSPLKITLPDTKGRYMSLMMIDEDSDIPPASYAPGSWAFTEKSVGTRYVMFVIRTFADPNDEQDMAEAHRLQDAVKVEQSDKGSIDGIPRWDEKKMLELRTLFGTLGSTLPDSSGFFGARGEICYLDKAMGVATGWGGLQKQDALYLTEQVEKNDGKTAYVLHVPGKVPVDGFWSVTVYNWERFMVKNEYHAYSFNNVTAKKNEDGCQADRS